jgi:endonuclease/exonuclease/phosphatase family metal-dependent hydrolase
MPKPRNKSAMPIPNDNISESLKKVIGGVPEQYRDSEQYFDLISWNLRWFNADDPERVNLIAEVLSYLNADIFVLIEIRKGSLDEVIEKLKAKKAGNYKVEYGTTGGDQRIAILYDIEWIRSKDDIEELFGKGKVRTGDNKDVFPRLPLKGYFLARPIDPEQNGFTFQLVGIHMKSQMGDGSSQRRMAGEKLAYWLEKEANDIDADTIIIGDWNKSPDDEDWKALQDLEKEDKVKFEAINDPSNISHLYYKNKNEWGSRLDSVLSTTEAYDDMVNKKAQVVQWVRFEELLQNAMNLKSGEIKNVITDIKNKLSDHMPLHVRYYLNKDVK